MFEEIENKLPDNFKGMKKEYILNCIRNNKIQIQWKPKIGDVMVNKVGSVFVISGKYKHELEEDDIYLFGGSLCNYKDTAWLLGKTLNKDYDGNILNDTCCFSMNKSGNSKTLNKHFHCKQEEFRYIPYPHELAKL